MTKAGENNLVLHAMCALISWGISPSPRDPSSLLRWFSASINPPKDGKMYITEVQTIHRYKSAGRAQWKPYIAKCLVDTSLNCLVLMVLCFCVFRCFNSSIKIDGTAPHEVCKSDFLSYDTMPSNVPVVMVVECSFLEQYDSHIMYICIVMNLYTDMGSSSIQIFQMG